MLSALAFHMHQDKSTASTARCGHAQNQTVVSRGKDRNKKKKTLTKSEAMAEGTAQMQ